MQDRLRSWLWENSMRIMTLSVLAIAAVSVAKYKLESLESTTASLVRFEKEQRIINMETDHKIDKLVHYAEMQQASDAIKESNQKEFNERLEKLTRSLGESIRSTEKLTAALDERTKNLKR